MFFTIPVYVYYTNIFNLESKSTFHVLEVISLYIRDFGVMMGTSRCLVLREAFR